MIGNINHSTWGIKDSGEDITSDILGILDNANSFIVVGGYNFTFKTAGYTFFSILQKKAGSGVPVLMIIPSNLPGSWSNQSTIINFCVSNGIGIILNGNNHSKWLLTEQDMYYGSSNFTETSWKQRIEVVSIHKHCNINRQWKKDTINDFRKFIHKEILRINSRPTMARISGLCNQTTKTWSSIKPLIKKLNPSVQKVKDTLHNYSDIEQKLEENQEVWFTYYEHEIFSMIYKMNSEILTTIINLCNFAYFNIYNETTAVDEIVNSDLIHEYNRLHSNVISCIDNNIQVIEKSSEKLSDEVIPQDHPNRVALNRILEFTHEESI